MSARPVTDATTPCPVCGATAWEATVQEGTCTACGHREGLPVMYAGDEASRVPDDEAEALLARRAAATSPELLATARFRVYRPTTGVVERGGLGWSRGRLVSCAVCQGDVEVETEEGVVREDPLADARRALERTLPSPPLSAAVSDAARALAFNATVRDRERRAATAVIGERVVVLDGTPTTFATATADGRIGAAASVDGTTVTITAPAAGFPDALRSVAPGDLR